MFGAKPATTLGGGTTSGGLFGNTQQQSTTGGGLFGGGASSTLGGSSTTGGGLFGAKPATTFGSGGATGGGLFGGATTLQQPQQVQQTLANINSQNPYGNNPLFQSITGGSTQAQQTNNVPQAKLIRAATPVKKSVTLGSTSQKITPLFKVSALPSKKPIETVQDEVFKKKTDSLFSSATDQAIISSKIFKPKESFKNLVLDKSNAPTGLLPNQPYSPSKPVTFVLDKSERPEIALSSTPEAVSREEKEIIKEQTPDGVKDVEEVVNKEGYWMSPSISELKKKSLVELKSIKGLKIGRKNYGELEFIEPVDLSSMVNFEDILGKLIIFCDHNCIIYPDDNKPKPGEGLNLPAKITLEGCYPTNRADKLPIVDPKSEAVKAHVEVLKTMEGMKFISYDPTNGNWTFEVKEVD